MNSWIKISDKLPDDYIDVLCYQEHFGFRILHRVRDTSGFMSAYRWMDEYGDEVPDHQYHITHWMHLPEKPEL